MKFRAESLEDVADHFDSLVKITEQKLAALPATKRATIESRLLKTEAHVWRNAAAIVRDTEIKPTRVR